jgi:hypothetical protein
MEAQEMEGLNEIMNEDDLDSEEEEFFFKVKGECTRCGRLDHKQDDRNCPAKGQKCKRCGKENHFRVRCQTKCKSCGCSHDQNSKNCPAYDRECQNCGQIGHIAFFCSFVVVG